VEKEREERNPAERSKDDSEGREALVWYLNEEVKGTVKRKKEY